MKFENENEMIMWILAVNGYRYSGHEKSLNDDSIKAAKFADQMVQELRKRMPVEESKK
jgi:hypothetical protein